MLTRRSFVTLVSGWLAEARSGTRSQAPGSLQGVWSGAVHARGATVKVLTAAPGLPISLTLSSEEAQISDQTAVADADGLAAFVLANLNERSRYRYEVRAPGESPVAGGFRTFADGPFSFRAVFASCADTGSTSPVFSAMRAQRPDLFIHMGDLHYDDITNNDVAAFRRAYARVLASPAQSALFRAVPLAYTWDDHDYGANNSGASSPSRVAALTAFRRFVPHYPLDDDPSATVHQAFTVGRVRFLMPDTRSARSSHRLPVAQRTMLGASQVAWLERELTAARDAPLVVWVNTVPWITKRFELFGSGWSHYSHERRRLADHITQLGLTRRLIMLSGDAHMLALDDGTHSQYSTRPSAPAKGFVVAHAAPMDRPTSKKGGPYTHGPVRANGQYGVLDVHDDGSRVTVQIQGMQGDVAVPGMRLTLTL